MFRTANPALSADVFRQPETLAGPMRTPVNVMTVHGTASKTAILLGLLLISASWTWYLAGTNSPQVIAWLIGGVIAGLVLAMVTIFKPTAAPVTAPLYALAQGLVLGAISKFFEGAYEGIAIQAVGLTCGVLAVMLFLYASRIIQVTDKFRLGVIAATGAIFLVYLVTFILSFFTANVPYIHAIGGGWGIGISLVIVVIAALNLALDFDLIERGAKEGAPLYMEWYGAFALMVTLIWLYIEILRLLAKLRGRD
jgi:uncharacterized YccA/Bax inhibitor family protein